MNNSRGRRPFRKEGYNHNQERREQNSRDKEEREVKTGAGDWKQRRDDRFRGPETAGRPERNRFRDRSLRPGQREVKYDKNGIPYERFIWTVPQLNTDPLPAPDCVRCGKPITDIHAALTDRNGEAVHFDCVMTELAEHETLEEGDTLSYIGGGRFGIVHFNNPGRVETKKFTIKKILEWENKENRAEWRGVIADHYSIT
ncbi:hypothetical protein AGMMS50230_10720 [Spirochaetia bacterium]|nr:hypothetical protein AGMMS50230_10720 [Spirochaetia bacterium]